MGSPQFLLNLVWAAALFAPSAAMAGPLDPSQRLIAMDRALACESGRISSQVVWQDVCTSDEYRQRRQELKDLMVSQALDQVQHSRSVPRRSEVRLASSVAAPTRQPEADQDIRPQRQGETESSLRANDPGPINKDPLHMFEFGTEHSFIKYTEPGFMEDKGMMNGIFAVYTQRTSMNQPVSSWKDLFQEDSKLNMFRVDGKVSFGKVDYESNGTGEIDGIKDYMIEARAVAGYDFPFNSQWRVTPYFGFGIRYLRDDMGGKISTTGAYGYNRMSRYLYLPVGLEARMALEQGWALEFMGEYDVLVGGTQYSYLDQVDPSYDVVENDQNSGFGLRGSMKIIKENPGWDFYVEPFVRYWHLDDSDSSDLIYGSYIIGYGIEPKNKSEEYGVKMGLRY